MFEILIKLKVLKEKYALMGFFIIGVFGSYARGENKKDSDIDIFYKIDKSFVKKFGGWKAILELEEIKKEISKKLGIAKVDSAIFDSQNQTLQNVIKKELIYV